LQTTREHHLPNASDRRLRPETNALREDYLRSADVCRELLQDTEDAQDRKVLGEMIEVWLWLAETR
jgi:hypothetical protein